MSGKSIAPHKPHQKWGDDKKAECAIALLAGGSIEKAARQCHISPKTLGHWSRHDDRFNEVLEGLQGEKALEHKHAYGLIVDKAQKVTLEKLDDATAAQANLIACQATDKGLLLDGKPTSITANANSQDSMLKFLEQIADAYREKQASVVSTQAPASSETNQ